jgi:hypothetical protein
MDQLRAPSSRQDFDEVFSKASSEVILFRTLQKRKDEQVVLVDVNARTSDEENCVGNAWLYWSIVRAASLPGPGAEKRDSLLETLKKTLEGKTGDDIAKEMNIHKQTVRYRVAMVKKMLGPKIFR